VGSFEFFWRGHWNANLHAYLACLGQCLSPTSDDRKDPFQNRQHDSEAPTDPRLRRKFHPAVGSKFPLHMQVAAAAAVETRPSRKSNWKPKQLLKPKLLETKAAVETKAARDQSSRWNQVKVETAWKEQKWRSPVCWRHSLDHHLLLQCWHLRVTSYCLKKAPGFIFFYLLYPIKRKSKRKTPFINILFDIVTPLYLVFSLLLKHTFQLSFKTFIWDFEKCILKKVSSIHTFHAKSCLQLSFQTFQM